jgi:uncharacterized lipoprotein
MKVERTKQGRSVTQYLKVLLLFGAVSGVSGCTVPVTLNTVQSYDVKTKRVDQATAFKRIAQILVDRGFDIKTSNQDAGIITTEYKKFASQGTNPPFDYYLQIKATLRKAPDGQLVVHLVPLVKSQNRLNAAAFTEHDLTYYTGEPNNVRLITSQQPGGWRAAAQTMFMNVVTDVAEVAGVSIQEVQQNVTTTPANAFLAK